MQDLQLPFREQCGLEKTDDPQAMVTLQEVPTSQCLTIRPQGCFKKQQAVRVVYHVRFWNLMNEIKKLSMVSWCSWLSRQSNTLKVSGSNPGEAILTSYIFSTISNVGCELDDYTGLQIQWYNVWFNISKDFK